MSTWLTAIPTYRGKKTNEHIQETLDFIYDNITIITNNIEDKNNNVIRLENNDYNLMHLIKWDYDKTHDLSLKELILKLIN